MAENNRKSRKPLGVRKPGLSSQVRHFILWNPSFLICKADTIPCLSQVVVRVEHKLDGDLHILYRCNLLATLFTERLPDVRHCCKNAT